MTKITWQAALCYTDCFHPSVLAANVDTSQNWRGQLMLQKKMTDKSFFFWIQGEQVIRYAGAELQHNRTEKLKNGRRN
jgi:hypothetical protein